MTDLFEKLDAQLAVVKDKFEALQSEEKSLKEKRADFDRQIAVNLEEQIRLQGEYRALTKLKEDAPDVEPKES